MTYRRCMSCLLVNTHSRTCPDLLDMMFYSPVPVVPGPYRLEDTYVISRDLPPPVTQPVPEDGRLQVMRPRWKADPLPTDTASWGLSFTGVMDAFSEPPQSHRKRRSRVRPIPVWTLVVIFLGLVLVGLSLAGCNAISAGVVG
jgi:hypothetical protein